MGVTKHANYTAEQNRIAALFKVLGHPARIAILQKLLATDCCNCRDFTDELDLAQPTVSRHLQELKSAGLIAGTIEGTSVSYCISATRWREVWGVLQMFLAAGQPGDTGCCGAPAEQEQKE